MSTICSYIITRGVRKGEQCGTKCRKYDSRCFKHHKTITNINNNKTQTQTNTKTRTQKQAQKRKTKENQKEKIDTRATTTVVDVESSSSIVLHEVVDRTRLQWVVDNYETHNSK